MRATRLIGSKLCNEFIAILMFGEMIWLQEGGCVGKARKRVLGNVGAIIAGKDGTSDYCGEHGSRGF